MSNTIRIQSLLLLLSGATLHIPEAAAHASEQGFVLLLPTNTYIAAGWLVVALTALAVTLLPVHSARSWSSSIHVSSHQQNPGLATFTSLLSSVFLFALLYVGFTGTHDPLRNLLPLTIWTAFWIGLVLLHGLFGNLWHWTNPWTGICNTIAFIGLRLQRNTGSARIAREAQTGHSTLSAPEKELVHSQTSLPAQTWPAVIGLLMFSGFVLADPAPDNPSRLAVFVFGYWLFTLIAMCVLGSERWLAHGEFFTVLFRAHALLSPLKQGTGGIRLGLPGWRALTSSRFHYSTSAAIFILVLLGTGSFDGLNETFWWLAKIGVNPLEFPGRSAVVVHTLAGILAANALLVLVFWCAIALGWYMAGNSSPQTALPCSMKMAFNRLALSVLPIAFAYHFAHYLPTLLVNGQYTLVAMSDPLANGADYIGLGKHYVSTGFFNSLDSVRVIWLSQAAAVVAGHVLSVIMAHAIATELYESRRRVLLGLLPLTIFMIFYTWLGLWLLAAARGV